MKTEEHGLGTLNVGIPEKHKELTHAIIGAFFDVYNSLGYGFLENVYENALAIVLREKGFRVEQQQPIYVYFRQRVVGDYRADLIVEDSVILEIKASRALILENEAQLLNYLKATPYEVGLLLNFGPKAEYKRKVYDNERKPNLRGGNQSSVK